MDSELILMVLFVAVALAVVAVGIYMQVRRHRAVVPPSLPTKETDEVLREAQEDAAQKTAELNFVSVGVQRPSLLAITPAAGQESSSAEVFIQRAFKIDRPNWRSLGVSTSDMRRLDCLFQNTCKLQWVPNSVFERHIYTVSFSPALEAAVNRGMQPRVLPNSGDLVIVALDANGARMGEPMDVTEGSWGEPAEVALLWAALNPNDRPHILAHYIEDEMKELNERAGIKGKTASSLPAVSWMQRVDELQLVAGEFLQLGLVPGRNPQRFARIEALRSLAEREAHELTKSVAEDKVLMRSLTDCLTALAKAPAQMRLFDLVMRVRRLCSILAVMGGDNFNEELQGANRLSDTVRFTALEELLDKAQQMAAQALSSPQPTDQVHAREVDRIAGELRSQYDALVEKIQEGAAEMQEQADRCLLLQSRPRRYAVRIDDDNHVEDLFVLQA